MRRSAWFGVFLAVKGLGAGVGALRSYPGVSSVVWAHLSCCECVSGAVGVQVSVVVCRRVRPVSHLAASHWMTSAGL